MSRLIDADKFFMRAYNTSSPAIIYGIAQLLDEQPTVDAVSVVHGHWKHTFGGYVNCSICDATPLLDGEREYVETTYCPNCGALMDEVTE